MAMHRYATAATLAAHGVRRHPRSSLMVVVVMALGLASSMTVLTVFRTLAGDPLHGRGAAVQTVLRQSQGRALAAGDALVKADVAKRVAGGAGHMRVMAAVVSTDKVQTDAERGPSIADAAVLAATSRVGEVFGIPLARGRWWSVQDDREHTPVAVVSQALAERLYGTTDVLGRTIRVGGSLLRIIGVRGAWQPTLRFYAQGSAMYQRKMAEVLVPLSVAMDAKLGVSTFACSGLMNDVWHECLIAQIWAYGLDAAERTQLLGLIPASDTPDTTGTHANYRLLNVTAWLRLQHVLPDSVRAYVWVAAAFLALCLFNAAGILAARFMRRGPELGVRRALGASRRDVFAQHLFESGCLTLLGGLLALPLVLGALALLRAQTVEYGAIVHFDVGTFFALCVVTVITGLLVGLYPAWRAAVRPPAWQIKQN